MSSCENPSLFDQSSTTKVESRWLDQSCLVFDLTFFNVSAMDYSFRPLDFFIDWICSSGDKNHQAKWQDPFHFKLKKWLITVEGLVLSSHSIYRCLTCCYVHTYLMTSAASNTCLLVAFTQNLKVCWKILTCVTNKVQCVTIFSVFYCNLIVFHRS